MGSVSADRVGARIGGRYVVEARLGRGGMGDVYRVRDDDTGSVIALKCMATTEAGERARLRFRREFHTMAILEHPRIVEVFDFGVDRDVPYYTMELLDGKDLSDLDKVPWQRVCEILHDVGSALAFLHARQLLHRDLAPRNVRCTSDGRAKLIDFGILATMGVVGDIAGTPPLVAPEALRDRPLDQRYDLFGFGALAYRILTGKHAFPARSIDELESTWRTEPAPVSELVPDVPPQLDELVMSLLARDAAARPASAAEVVDRLAAIGKLDRPAELSVTRGWIASAALVGRTREMAQVKRAIARARDGKGHALLVEGVSGMGKSRLLREVALEAQLAGMHVVRAGDSAGRGPYGVLHELARGLIASLPEAADAAAQPRAAMLARVITSFRQRLQVEPAKPAGDPAEDRLRVQHELAAWVLEIAARQPIALCIDDIQRCDEASAAVLAAIAHQAQSRTLLVAAALRTDEPVRAPAAIASLSDAGPRLRLRALDEAQLAELCRSIFGNVAHVGRLAHWMHDVADGSPYHATLLSRHLVDRGVIRYVQGAWVIPDDPGEHDLPRGLADALDLRVRALPDATRALAEALSIHGGELTLDVIVALADTRSEQEVFDALDRLGFEEILAQAGEHWRFRHDGVREALVRGLSPDRKRELHRRVGEMLAAGSVASFERDAEIGWHLLHGGEPVLGAARLERAGRALYDAQSFQDSIAPLEVALAVHQRERRSPRLLLELQHMLLMAGCMADRKVALRYSEACIRGFRYWSGVDVADHVRKLTGRHVGIVIGLLWAMTRWLVRLGRGPFPVVAFQTFFIVVGYSATLYSLSFDFARTSEMLRLLEPIAILRKRLPYAMYLLVANLHHFPRGEVGIAERNCTRMLEIHAHDRLTPIREIDRRTGKGGALYMRVVSDIMNLSPALEADMAQLRQLELKFFDVGIAQAKVILHRVRGEEETAHVLEADLEVRFVQLGSIWQMEAFMPVISSLAYAHTRDVLALRRTIEQLGAMCSEGFRYEPFLELARGEYLRERGDARGSLATLEPCAARDDLPMMQIAALCALAETLLVLDEPERARTLAAKGLAVASAPDIHNLYGAMRNLRTLALAEAACGDVAGAAARLDATIEAGTCRASPLLLGNLHDARARVALVAGDVAGAAHHVAEAERVYRSTNNPVLIAHAQRLAGSLARKQTVRANDHADPDTVMSPGPVLADDRKVATVTSEALTTPPTGEVPSWVSGVLASCRGAAERAQRALELVIAESQGRTGYLYLRRGSVLELVAPSWGDEPAGELVQALEQRVYDPDVVPTVRAISPAREHHVVLPLQLPDDDGRVIGGVIVLGGAMPLVEPAPRLLQAIARKLADSGDVVLMQETVA